MAGRVQDANHRTVPNNTVLCPFHIIKNMYFVQFSNQQIVQECNYQDLKFVSELDQKLVMVSENHITNCMLGHQYSSAASACVCRGCTHCQVYSDVGTRLLSEGGVPEYLSTNVHIILFKSLLFLLSITVRTLY